MNIVLVIIDTLRYDYIGANGNDWMHTPNLDELAAESWVFDRSYTASYPTIPHRTDVMTGRHGGPFYPWRPLRFDALTMPETLAKAGYCTQLIHDTPHLVNGGHNFDWPFHAWTFIRGAEVDRPWIDCRPDLPANWRRDPLFDSADWDVIYGDRTIVTYARANRGRAQDEDWSTAKLFLTASEWLRENASRNRFFLWIDCFDPHEPWDAPPEFARMYDQAPGYDGRVDPRSFVVRNDPNLPDAAKARVKALYAAKVSWVDRWLGEFLMTMEETGLAKNTAVVLTADHGTNVGERSRFGKGYPVREQEGHIPLFIRVPGGGSGRNGIIVQPQDLFATIMGLAGLTVPGGLDSYDILSIARRGLEGPRKVALSGRGADAWASDPDGVLFTVFDGEWCLELAARLEACNLTRLGSLENVAAGNQEAVKSLRRLALDEIERRGADPALMAWLKSNGEGDFPQDCRFWDGWPGPAGYAQYFGRLYTKWPV